MKRFLTSTYFGCNFLNMFDFTIRITYTECNDENIFERNIPKYTNLTRYFNLRDYYTRYYRADDDDLCGSSTLILSNIYCFNNELFFRYKTKKLNVILNKIKLPYNIIKFIPHGSLWVLYLASKGIYFPSLNLKENVEWVYDTSDFSILKYAPKEFRKYFSKGILDAVDNAILA